MRIPFISVNIFNIPDILKLRFVHHAWQMNQKLLDQGCVHDILNFLRMVDKNVKVSVGILPFLVGTILKPTSSSLDV